MNGGKGEEEMTEVSRVRQVLPWSEVSDTASEASPCRVRRTRSSLPSHIFIRWMEPIFVSVSEVFSWKRLWYHGRVEKTSLVGKLVFLI